MQAVRLLFNHQRGLGFELIRKGQPLFGGGGQVHSETAFALPFDDGTGNVQFAFEDANRQRTGVETVLIVIQSQGDCRAALGAGRVVGKEGQIVLIGDLD